MGLMDGGDQGCFGACARPPFICWPSVCIPSFADDPAILAPACWADTVGDTGEPRRGLEGIPLAEARLLAIEDGLSRRVLFCVGRRGGCCPVSRVEFAALGRDDSGFVSCGAGDGVVVSPSGSGGATELGCSCWNLRI